MICLGYSPIILHNFACRPYTLACATLHKALPVGGTVLAREMYRPLAHPFVATKERVLPHLPARVASQQVRITRRVAQGCLASIVSADAREDTLQLLQTALSVVLDLLGSSSGCIG